MFTNSLPGLKAVLSRAGLRCTAATMAARMMTAFMLHSGRMSCVQAATAIRGESRHRAQVGRFLARWSSRLAGLEDWLRAELLRFESSSGTYVFVVDQTLCGQAGKQAENTFSTGNRQRRPAKRKRHGKYRYHRRSCHAFTAGLLLTPSGQRIPMLSPYRTKAYCEAHGMQHRTTAEAAADMVRKLKVPPGARVIVVGDTAYESWVVREACDARGFCWIFPSNPERVLEGSQGERVRLRSLMDDRSTWSWQTIRLTPSQGAFAAQRRLSRYRIGPKAKSRTYRVKPSYPLDRGCTNGLFDNERKLHNCQPRRHEDSADERDRSLSPGNRGSLYGALADRVVLQGTEVVPGLRPVQLQAVHRCRRLGIVGHLDVPVPGVVSGQAARQ